MRQLLIPLSLIAGTALALGQGKTQAPPSPPPSPKLASAALPPGPGHDTMVRVCSACHDPAIAAQQRLSPDGWKELVDQMAARGAKASDAELDEITTYLAKAFPEGGAATP